MHNQVRTGVFSFVTWPRALPIGDSGPKEFAVQRLEADVAVALVRGVERAAQQADPAARVARHPGHRMVGRGHGLSVPLPRTTFL